MKPEGDPSLIWELCSYSDMDCTGDNHTRKIVTGYIVIIKILVIEWHPKS